MFPHTTTASTATATTGTTAPTTTKQQQQIQDKLPSAFTPLSQLKSSSGPIESSQMKDASEEHSNHKD